jgi:hypothetical protein
MWSNIIVGAVITVLGLATMAVALGTARGTGRRACTGPSAR